MTEPPKPIPPPPPLDSPAIAADSRSTATTPLTDLLATGAVERVAPNIPAARLWLRDAAAHIRTARGNVDDDPRGAVSLAHQAARKAITAHMILGGYRPTGGEGGHRHVVDYAANELEEEVAAEDLDALDRLRRTRNQADYGDDAAIITSDHGRLALEAAERVVNGVTSWVRDNRPDVVPPEPRPRPRSG